MWAQQQWHGLMPPAASIPWVSLEQAQAQLPMLLTDGSFVEVVNIDPISGQVDPSTSVYQIMASHPVDAHGV